MDPERLPERYSCWAPFVYNCSFHVIGGDKATKMGQAEARDNNNVYFNFPLLNRGPEH